MGEAQPGCDTFGAGSCNTDGTGTNCCLGVPCSADSVCTSGHCTPLVSGMDPHALGACVQSAGDLGLAGYYCQASSQCQSGRCTSAGCGGSVPAAGYLKVGDYCSDSPFDSYSITHVEADSQCASGNCNTVLRWCRNSDTAWSR